MKEDIKRVLDEHARGNFYSDLFRLQVSEEIEKIVNKSLKIKGNDNGQSKNKGVAGNVLPDTSGLARRDVIPPGNAPPNVDALRDKFSIKNKITSNNKVGKSTLASAPVKEKVTAPVKKKVDALEDHRRKVEPKLAEDHRRKVEPKPANDSRIPNKKKVNKKSVTKRTNVTKRTKRTNTKRK